MAQITIKTLAKELRLSVGTISKALHNSHEISLKTKKRVTALAAKWNYIPNAYAGSLRARKTRTIGVVIPEIADSFFSLALQGIESVARENGFHVLVYLTHESFQQEQSILKEFQSGRVDGILLSVAAATTHGQHIQALRACGIPVVFFDRVMEEAGIAKIMTDDLETGYLATRHLIEQGCSRIAYLSVSRHLMLTAHRMAGYKKALADHGLPDPASHIIFCTGDGKSMVAAITKLLRRKSRPQGIIASVEKLIAPVYTACTSLQINIPGDIKVIAFSNLSSAFMLSPSLTTIEQPAFEMGMAAATFLFKSFRKKNGQTEPETRIIPSTLCIRKSTANKAG